MTFVAGMLTGIGITVVAGGLWLLVWSVKRLAVLEDGFDD